MRPKPPSMTSREPSAETFYSALLPVVDAALRRVITARDPEYEDLLQSAVEAVLAAIRKDTFRGDASFSTWASAIARNVAIDTLRTRSRARRMFVVEADADEAAAGSHAAGPSPELMADVRQRLARYEQALRTLGSKARVVILSDVHGYTLEQIAAALGLSVAAAQSRLVRARREIAHIMASVERAEPEGRAEVRPRRSGVKWRAYADSSKSVSESSSIDEDHVESTDPGARGAVTGKCRDA